MVSPAHILRRLRPAAVPALGVAVALGLAGCGGSSHDPGTRSATGSAGPTSSSVSASSSSSVSSSSSTGAARRRRPRPRPRGAPVGAVLTVHAGTTTLRVTVSRVLDPLTGTGSKLLPGHRATGVQVSISAVAGETYDSTASGDWSILTTAGLASPLFVKQGVCETQLADFESLIGVGDTRDGCVAFSVPRHARILSVRFSPHSRARGTVAWR